MVSRNSLAVIRTATSWHQAYVAMEQVDYGTSWYDADLTPYDFTEFCY